MMINIDNNTTVCVLIFLCLIWSLQSNYFNNKKADRDLKLMQMQLTIKIDREAILKMLDDFIEEVLNDYISQHTKYITAIYISTDMQTDMVDSIVNSISERMSPYLYQRLSLIYNESAIADVIANKVVILVTVFVSDRNTVKPKEQQKTELDL